MNKSEEHKYLEVVLKEAHERLQSKFGVDIKLSLIVEGMKESELLSISEQCDEPIYIAGESWTLCVPSEKNELILHNGGLPF